VIRTPSRPPLPVLLGSGVVVLAAAGALAVGRSGAAGAIVIVGGAGALAYANLALALCAVIPAVVFLHGVPTSIPLSGGLTLGVLAGGVLAGAVPPIVARWRFLVALALFSGWMLVALRWPGTSGPAHPGTTTDLLALLGGPVLFALAIASRCDRRWLDASLIATASVGGWCAGLFGTPYDTDKRVELFGLNPNFLAVVFVVGIVAATARLNRSWGLFVVVALPGMVYGLILTQSRGGLFTAGAGMVAVVLGWALDGRPRRFGRGDLAVMSAIAIIGVFLPFSATIDFAGGGFGRSTKQLDQNNHARLSAAGLAYHLAQSHPVRGVGIGRFPYIAAHDPDVRLNIATHDEYVRLAAESGFVGLGLFVITVGVAVLGVGWKDLEAAATPFAFLVSLLFVNGLSTMAVAAPFWIALGSRIGRVRGSPPG
jgi:hypothetical protein